MVGVGAAFDFLAGVKPQAPRWLRDHGFEWLFRLVTEPKRLWRRYLIDYPLFVCYLLADMVKNRSNSCKS
jgi:N-acetylglucosaminyldiphosphoundecaprenol N-acetyl-beta-D-mannosaminyltransferase